MRRSQLYVPGNREDMIRKAASLDSDSVVLDLEDSVPSDQKASSRTLVERASTAVDWRKKEVCVRVNNVKSKLGKQDIEFVGRLERVDTILVPKAEEDLSWISRETGKLLIPIIETARGLDGIQVVLGSSGIAAVTYGAADFALSVGGDVKGFLDNIYVKTKIIVTARAQGLEAVDNVYFDLKDMVGFRRQALTAKRLGYSGKQVIHPSQIPVANEVFTPSKSELERAERIVAEFEASRVAGRGAIRVGDELVDEVHYKIAKGIIERGLAFDTERVRRKSKREI